MLKEYTLIESALCRCTFLDRGSYAEMLLDMALDIIKLYFQNATFFHGFVNKNVNLHVINLRVSKV